LTPTPVGDAYVSVEHLNDVQETYPIELFLCRGCGLAQLLDVVNPEVLYSNFIYTTSISLGLVDHFQRYADNVLGRVHPPEESLVIDIGSNDGTLLRFFKERGLRVLGVDPAREIARDATASGIETLPTLFTTDLARTIRQTYGPAAIVTANHTFANVDDSAELIEGIRTLLAPDGAFVFETGYLVDLLQNGLFDNIYHEHLCYFSIKPLESFFRRHGMELVDVERLPVKGGAVRGVVQRTGGNSCVSPSVGELITLETRLGVDHADPFTILATRIDTAKNRLTHLLLDLRAQGKLIAGYGASVGVTTLIYHFGLGDVLSFLVDDNPTKHHTFSPGHHIPVYSSPVLYERNPDFVLILAWRYAEPIATKHQTYIDQGGHFIIPWPELEVR
jgi:SAM-dependent methyltransferase